MQLIQTKLCSPAEIETLTVPGQLATANLVLVFASPTFFGHPGFAEKLRQVYPQAHLLGCSTAGEITDAGVEEGSCTLTALQFEQADLRPAATHLMDMSDSLGAGERIGQQLAAEDLRAVLLFGPGVQINGSALVRGLAAVVGETVTIIGGLAGDDGAFRETFTLGDAGVANNAVVAVGLYGEHLAFAHGSFGGWEPFGPARRISRCDGNVLYELDNEPALDIYKRYLGEHAEGLPATGLLFPFALLGEDHAEVGLIRTILGIDEANGSLTLAGEVPDGGYLRLMHASTDRLVNGAEAAAEAALSMRDVPGLRLAILVSCVGRKLVMGSRVDDEVDAVADVLGQETFVTGFYSYGEISPFAPGVACKLHNQTMTITLIGED